LVAHLWLEADGPISVTPTVKITPSDELRLRAATCGFTRWRSASERLWEAVLKARERGR
jgi:hypothetical protein